jgi:hypothetical protein
LSLGNDESWCRALIKAELDAATRTLLLRIKIRLVSSALLMKYFCWTSSHTVVNPGRQQVLGFLAQHILHDDINKPHEEAFNLFSIEYF